MTFEDLDFFCNHAVQYLLSFLKTQERYDLPILALKTINFVLNPANDFKNRYITLLPNNKKLLQDNLNGLYSYTSIVLKEILRSQLLKSDFL